MPTGLKKTNKTTPPPKKKAHTKKKKKHAKACHVFEALRCPKSHEDVVLDLYAYVQHIPKILYAAFYF